ncbi:type II secretion system protein N [Thalassotalea fusca]
MKKWIAFAALFIGAYLLFVIQQLPISYVLSSLPLPKNVSLGSATGNVWQFELSHVQVDDIRVNQVNVNLREASLLTLDPTFDVKFGSPMAFGPEGTATISGVASALVVEHANVMLPANDIAQQLPLLVPVDAKSDVTLQVTRFEIGTPICKVLDGRVEWRAAAVEAMEQMIELGDLAAKLVCEKGEIVATISPNNQLGLTFEAVVSENFRVHGDGHIQPTADTPEAIKQSLPFLGKPDNQGRYRLRF